MEGMCRFLAYKYWRAKMPRQERHLRRDPSKSFGWVLASIRWCCSLSTLNVFSLREECHRVLGGHHHQKKIKKPSQTLKPIVVSMLFPIKSLHNQYMTLYNPFITLIPRFSMVFCGRPCQLAQGPRFQGFQKLAESQEQGSNG